MKASDFVRRAMTACAAYAVLAGCSLRQNELPSGAVSSAARERAASGDAFWIAPDAHHKDLLYVSDLGTNKVNVYSYPGGKPEGTLSGFQRPQAMCVDKEGDVFIPDLQAFKIYEYRHGGKKPQAVLRDPGEDPGDCAFDSKTGNLAVANVSTPYTGDGDIVVYTNARGKPRRYRDPHIVFYQFCAYDEQGNLYVDGMNGGKFQFAELRAGSSSFTDVTLDETFRFPGAVLWDGHNVAISDYESNVIYRFNINGEHGNEIGKTRLNGSNFAIGLWIQGSTVIGPNDDGTSVMYWTYPTGGRHTKKIDGLQAPWGAVVSPAK